MEILVGIVLALAIGLIVSFVGMDRDRACYPVMMIVIASYYLLFAVSGDSPTVLVPELIFAAIFFGAAIAGFRYSLWIVVVALAAHGVFDITHEHLVKNPGMPRWWPNFCMAYDVMAAGYLAAQLLLASHWRRSARPCR